MASNTFYCAECQLDLKESSLKRHFSAIHLNYYPYHCESCKRKGQQHATATEEDMDIHNASTHSGMVSNIILSKIPSQEDALRKAIKECRRSSLPQDPVDDKNAVLQQILSGLGDRRISSIRGNTALTAMATANEPVLTQTTHKRGNCETPVSSIDHDGDILNAGHATVGTTLPWHSKSKQGSSHFESSKQPHLTMTLKTNTTERVFPYCDSMPYEVYIKRTEDDKRVEASRLITQMVSDSTRNSGENVPVIKIEPVEQNSPVPEGPRPRARLVSIVTEEAHSDNTQDIVIPPVIIRNRKRTASINPYYDPAKSNQKRPTMVELKDDCSRLASSNGTTPETKRHHANDGSRETSNKSRRCKSLVSNERFARPMTSSQTSLSVSKSKKHSQEPKVENLTIFISDGTVSFRTSDGHSHNKAPLSSHFPILKKSKPADNGCKTLILFIRPWTAKQKPAKGVTSKVKTKNVFESLAHFKAFKDQLHSIAFLWANSKVEATFSRYPDHKKAVSLSVFCDSLFNKQQSILVCKELDITLNENWPLSIVTNVADRIRKGTLNLRVMTLTNGSLHKELLDELYSTHQMKLPEEVKIILEIHHEATSDEFVRKLKERCRRSTGRYFKFELRSDHINVFSISPMQCSLKAKRLDTGRLSIKQRPNSPPHASSASSTRFL
ncbi:hypothetical protein DdX_19755 [Ditylenchus destructor]|uniref:Uncharacterized protein n=1 Tax=Ditylenchus destructor TaxID=166010 RepID=A0AAD4MHD8_9BILA|nr:hypothetical protein DdX_19755 [Ditylenchus destructor]